MELQRSRNRGVVPLAVAAAASSTTVAIAGTGGVGGSIARRLVQQVGLKRLKLADFDTYTETNLNRQDGAAYSTLGQPKVKVVAESLADIDRSVEIITYGDGVTLENIDDFLDGADLVVDAIDFTAPDVHIALTRRARELGIPVLMGIEIGYGARMFWFDPKGQTFEEFFGIKLGASQLDLKKMIVRLPSYVNLRDFKAISDGKLEAPAIATGGSVVSAMLVPLLEAHISGIDIPAAAPVVAYVDTKEMKAGVIRSRTLAWWSSVGKVVLRNALHLNPSTFVS